MIDSVSPDGTEELFAFDTSFANGLVHQFTIDGEVTEIAELPGNDNGHLAWRDGELIVAARGRLLSSDCDRATIVVVLTLPWSPIPIRAFMAGA